MSENTSRPFQPMQTPGEIRKKKAEQAILQIKTIMVEKESGQFRISWKGSSIQVEFSHYLELDKG